MSIKTMPDSDPNEPYDPWRNSDGSIESKVNFDEWVQAADSAPPTEITVPVDANRIYSSPDDLRSAGWTVAVHNDYRLNGEPFTFWLLTKNGQAVKGEGRTDADALNAIRCQLDQTQPTAAELLSEIIAEFDGQIMLDGFAIRRVSAIVDRAIALGYGAAKATELATGIETVTP